MGSQLEVAIVTASGWFLEVWDSRSTEASVGDASRTPGRVCGHNDLYKSPYSSPNSRTGTLIQANDKEVSEVGRCQVSDALMASVLCVVRTGN